MRVLQEGRASCVLCSVYSEALPNMACPSVAVNRTLMPSLQFFSLSTQYTHFQVPAALFASSLCPWAGIPVSSSIASGLS